MTVDVATVLMGFVTQPSFGIPLTILVAVLVYWGLAFPRAQAPRYRPRSETPPRAADLVGEAYFGASSDSPHRSFRVLEFVVDLELLNHRWVRLRDIPRGRRALRKLGLPEGRRWYRFGEELRMTRQMAWDYELPASQRLWGNLGRARQKRRLLRKIDKCLDEWDELRNTLIMRPA